VGLIPTHGTRGDLLINREEIINRILIGIRLASEHEFEKEYQESFLREKGFDNFYDYLNSLTDEELKNFKIK
jgi:hypothetical protein